MPSEKPPPERDPAIPRIPRKSGWKLAVPDLIRIGFFASLLALVVFARKPCADSTADFVQRFDEVDAGATGPAPAQNLEYRQLSDEELKERFKSFEAGDAGTVNPTDASPSNRPDSPPSQDVSP